MTIFERKKSPTTKMNITFFVEIGVTNTVLNFLIKNPHTGWMKAENLVLEAHFLYISNSIDPIIFKNN